MCVCNFNRCKLALWTSGLTLESLLFDFFCSWRILFSRGTIHVLWAMVQRSGHSTCGYHGWSPWRTCQSVSSFADITWGQTKNPFTTFSVIAVSACCALLFSPPLWFTVLQRREGSALFCWDFFVVRWLHYIGHVNFCPNSISSFWQVYWTVFARKMHSNFTIWKTVLSKRAHALVIRSKHDNELRVVNFRTHYFFLNEILSTPEIWMGMWHVAWCALFNDCLGVVQCLHLLAVIFQWTTVV